MIPFRRPRESTSESIIRPGGPYPTFHRSEHGHPPPQHSHVPGFESLGANTGQGRRSTFRGWEEVGGGYSKFKKRVGVSSYGDRLQTC